MLGPLTVASPSLSILVDAPGLDGLIGALRGRGYDVLGPRVMGTAINLAPIAKADDLPRGWISRQEAGSYRLEQRPSGGSFGYGPAVDSLKRYLNPPVSTIWRATREDGSLRFEPSPSPPAPLAILGARPCDLHAMARCDDIFLNGPYKDPGYEARRASLFIVAANCTTPGGTCFCASMATGPRASAHFDVALTELAGAPGAERYVATSGSATGRAVLEQLHAAAATSADLAEEQRLLDDAAKHMGRTVPMTGLASTLSAAAEHPQWDDVAHRCLACANCTMVCPTCFCSTVDDRTNLAGTVMERERRWDSCFTSEFSYIHGGSTRPSTRARYRQWLTHKFVYWADQFGAPGCVGCGRCITWCPVGIDITQEIRSLGQPSRVAGERGRATLQGRR